MGYNWQAAAFVYGLEADISYRSLSKRAPLFLFGSTPTAGNPFGSVAGDNALFKVDQTWFGTVRGRLGYAVANWLFYGTGGLAYGSVKHSVTETLVAPNADRFRTISDRDTQFGWTAGGGFEVAFSSQWSAGVEYLYVDLGKSTIAQGAITNLVVFPADTIRFHDKSHVARLRLNYSLGGYQR